MYSKLSNSPQRESCLKEIESYKTELISFIIDDLFLNNKLVLNSLSFDDINKRFEDYRYVL